MTSEWLPSLPKIAQETLAVLAATILAAYIISRVPSLQRFVAENSVTLR